MVMTCASESSWRSCWSFFAGLAVGTDASHGDERQSQVADAGEQPVQGGLVHGWAPQGGRAVTLVCEGQTVHPVRPPGVEVSLHADLVPLELAASSGRSVGRR